MREKGLAQNLVKKIRTPSNTKPALSFIEEARRKQILEFALIEIQQHGYGKATIPRIAEMANISRGVIYYYFKSKEELLANIWQALIDELFEYRKNQVEAEEGCNLDRLRIYCRANREFLMRNKNKFTTLYKVGIDFEEPARTPKVEKANERCFKYLSSIIKAGQQSGEFREFPAEMMAPIIQGTMDGILCQWATTPDLYEIEACENQLFEIIKTYICKDPGIKNSKVR
jgi:TetR/AcrR family fatty acid metabolism transcriptional regulator